VGVSLASGSPRVDGSVVAHAAGVTSAMVASIQAPVSFVMPQFDAGFNNNAAAFLNITLTLGIEAQFRMYPNVSHGFAAAFPSSPQQAVQKERAFMDSVQWLHEHAW
jgi:dienelactone hydrolase